MNKDTGGPAFPSGMIDPLRPEDSVHAVDKGMTLRDYFAAHASEEDVCVALDSVQKVERVKDLGNGHHAIERGYPDNARQIARYIHADQMLKAREQ